MDKTGELINIEVLISLAEVLRKESIRVVKKMPPWEPGMQDGEEVKVRYKLPINYSLD